MQFHWSFPKQSCLPAHEQNKTEQQQPKKPQTKPPPTKPQNKDKNLFSV